VNNRNFGVFLILIIVFGVTACSSESKLENYSEAEFVEFGQELVMEKCASCHSVTKSGASPRSDAPPLRTVLSLYNSESLADDFRVHIHVGHPDMPNFNFSVKETEGVLTYLKSIQVTSVSE